MISQNPGGERALIPTRPDGAKVRAVQAPDPLSEGIWIAKEIARMAGGVDMLDAQHMAREAARPFSDIAVLCRTRRQLEQIETCLAHDSIPCVIYGRDAFLEDAAVQGALGFFASLTDPQDAPSLTACLTALWRVPAPLCQRAAAALSQSAGEADPPRPSSGGSCRISRPLRPGWTRRRRFSPAWRAKSPAGCWTRCAPLRG